MTNDDLLQEMESLVEAIEQSLAITIGVISETSDPAAVLRNLLAGEMAMSNEFGANGWRDRIVRKMQLVAALKARPAAESDPSLKSLIATLLKSQEAQGKTH